MIKRQWEYHTCSGRHWDYHALSARWDHHTLNTACWEYYCHSAARWEYDTLRAVQPTNTQARRRCIVPNKYIVKTIIFSSFNNIELLRSMLANCCMWRCRGEGTMAAIGQWNPPWLGCVFIPSFCLANCVSDVPPPQNHQKPNHCPTSYLRQ